MWGVNFFPLQSSFYIGSGKAQDNVCIQNLSPAAVLTPHARLTLTPRGKPAMNIDSKGLFHHPLLYLLLTAAFLAGCSPRVYTEQDQDAKLTGYHRFAWLTPPATPVRDPILDSQILESRVHHAVTE